MYDFMGLKFSHTLNWHQLTLFEPPRAFFSVIFNEFVAAAAIGILFYYATFKKNNFKFIFFILQQM